MALQFSIVVRNARLDALETAISANPVLKIRTGSKPANCNAADTGTVLATMTLPSDWMAVASGGVKEKLGTWQDAEADANGVAGHFRIYDSTGTTCHLQGSVSAAGGGGDMQLDNVVINEGQQVTVTTFTLTDGGA
jgi:hypothetical protein